MHHNLSLVSGVFIITQKFDSISKLQVKAHSNFAPTD